MTRTAIIDLSPTMQEIEKRINVYSKPTLIAKELKISIGTYYNLLNKINERNNSSEFKAQYEEEITGGYKLQLQESIKLYDKAETIDEKNKCLKLMNDILKNYAEFLFKTGRIKEVSKKIEIESNINVDYNLLYEEYQAQLKQSLPKGNIIEQLPRSSEKGNSE